MAVGAGSMVGPIHGVVLALLVGCVPGHAQSQAYPARDFKFNEADLRLLEHSCLLDKQLQIRGLVFQDSALDAFLAKLAPPLLGEASPPQKVVWEFRVIRDPSVNAFALPNGSVYVTTGLLAALENEAQLSGVLAREIAHVRNRHAYLHNREYRKKMAALNVVSVIPIEAFELQVPGLFLPVIAKVNQVLLAVAIHGYAEHFEREADLFAVNRTSEAGWDAVQVPKALGLLGDELDVQTIPTFYQDRSKLMKRAAYTSSAAKGKGSTTSKTGATEDYLAAVEKAIRYNIQADIDSRRFRTALTSAQKLANWRTEDAESVFLLAEAYRALGPRTPRPTSAELTPEGRTRARDRLLKRTLEEEERELLRTASGRQAAKMNQATAEQLYRGIISRDSFHAKAHRGLGLLLQQQGKSSEACEELRRYLELEPGVPDRRRIEERIQLLEELRRGPAQSGCPMHEATRAALSAGGSG